MGAEPRRRKKHGVINSTVACYYTAYSTLAQVEKLPSAVRNVSTKTCDPYRGLYCPPHLQSVPQVYFEVRDVVDGELRVRSCGHRRSDTVGGAKRVLLRGHE